MDLTDEQWEALKPIIPVPPRRADGRGRPWRDPRAVLHGISGSCGLGHNGRICPRAIRRIKPVTAGSNTGSAPASSSGSCRPWPQTCGSAVSWISPSASSTAPSWWPIKGTPGGKDKRGKGTKVMAMADRAGLPLAVHVAAASPHEVTLVEPTLAACVVDARPEHLIRDKAYDSDLRDERLAEEGIELIAPHRSNRQKPKTQDGRPSRRYKRRGKVERLFAWLPNFRRILVRHEYYAENYRGFVQLGCTIILLMVFMR
jgi:transposase